MTSESSRAVPKYLSDLLRNGTPAGLSDAELLNRFASRRGARDETAELAFAALLARHGPMVLRVCHAVLGDRHEVEDAFQATFLVLAVRVHSIRLRGSAASWLHGVALRVAASERSRLARRRRHELVRATMTSTSSQDAGNDAVSDQEMRLVINEEIGRLPEKYRAPVVLCYLEDLTHEMAAERLGWPVGSVKSRLAWAHERLRARLIRRGVSPATLPFDRTVPTRDAESAPIPAVVGTYLLDTTLRGALIAGTGKEALAGIVSAQAISLMEGTIRSMTNAKLIFVATACLIAGLATAGLGMMGYSTLPQENPPGAGNPGQGARRPVALAERAQEPPGPGDLKSGTNQRPVTIEVDVVDPAGQRLAGADVAVIAWYTRQSGKNESVLKQTKTNGIERVRMELAPERPDASVFYASVWAYQPGRALDAEGLSIIGPASPPSAHLVLKEPVKCTIRVVGADDQSIAGLRLIPHTLRRGLRKLLDVPDTMLEALTVITDAKGTATITYLPEALVPLSIDVVGTAVARHTLPLDVPQGKNYVLKLGGSGKLVGIVRTADGAPLVDASVEVRVRGSGNMPSNVPVTGTGRITSDEVIPFDPRALKSGPQGAFQPIVTLTGLLMLRDYWWKTQICTLKRRHGHYGRGRHGFSTFSLIYVHI